MPCIPLNVSRRFGGICRLYLHAGFLSGFFFDPDHGGNMFIPRPLRREHVSPERRLTFNGLYGVIYQKI
jgi:hypothetical protein